MPPRSNAITLLAPHLRQEVERQGKDGQRCIPGEVALFPAPFSEPAIGFVPMLHCASPRIPADPCSSRTLAQRLISASGSHLAKVVFAGNQASFTLTDGV